MQELLQAVYGHQEALCLQPRGTVRRQHRHWYVRNQAASINWLIDCKSVKLFLVGPGVWVSIMNLNCLIFNFFILIKLQVFTISMHFFCDFFSSTFPSWIHADPYTQPCLKLWRPWQFWKQNNYFVRQKGSREKENANVCI